MGAGKTPRLSNEEGRTFEVEADSLEEAKKEVNSRVPKGLQLLSRKIISDGKPKMSLGIAETVEVAFQEARNGLPSSAIVTEDKILVPPGKISTRTPAVFLIIYPSSLPVKQVLFAPA